MKHLLLVPVFMLCFACSSTTVPVVKEAPICAMPASIVAACGSPVAIKPGVSYGELIEAVGRDRDALRECALRHKALADAAAACKDDVEQYNAVIRAINARDAAQR